MRDIRLAVGVAAVACALGVGAASASAHEFSSSGGTTKGTQVGTEEFAVWPMKVSCNKSTSKGSAPVGKFMSYTSETKYSQCTTFGGGVKVTVSPAQWEYSAENTVTLLKEITIKPGSGLPCHYTIEAPQTMLTKESVIYGDETLPITKGFPEGQKKLNIYSKFSGMTYTATGWPCTGPKSAKALAEERTETSEGEGGSFVGGVHEEVLKGSLAWIE
jgi:hypothetical protein